MVLSKCQLKVKQVLRVCFLPECNCATVFTTVVVNMALLERMGCFLNFTFSAGTEQIVCPIGMEIHLDAKCQMNGTAAFLGLLQRLKIRVD